MLTEISLFGAIIPYANHDRFVAIPIIKYDNVISEFLNDHPILEQILDNYGL